MYIAQQRYISTYSAIKRYECSKMGNAALAFYTKCPNPRAALPVLSFYTKCPNPRAALPVLETLLYKTTKVLKKRVTPLCD